MQFKHSILLLCSFVVMTPQFTCASQAAFAGKVVSTKKAKSKTPALVIAEPKSFAETVGGEKEKPEKSSILRIEANAPKVETKMEEVSLAAAVITAAAAHAPEEMNVAVAPSTPVAASVSSVSSSVSVADSSNIKISGFGVFPKLANWSKGTPGRVMSYLEQAVAEKKHIDMKDNETDMVVSSAIAQIVADKKGQQLAIEFLEAAGKQVNDQPILRLSRAQRQSLRQYLKPHLNQQSATLEAEDEDGYKARTAKRDHNFANVQRTLKAVNLSRSLKDVRDAESSDEEDAALPEKEAFGIEKAKVAIAKKAK